MLTEVVQYAHVDDPFKKKKKRGGGGLLSGQLNCDS